MDQTTLYKQEIIENYKTPKNFGKIIEATHTCSLVNKSCGDEIEVTLKIENSIIKDLRFTGTGCAISIASASILSEKVKGLNLEKYKEITSEEVLKRIGMTKESGRVKCALIGWEAINKAIQNGKN